MTETISLSESKRLIALEKTIEAGKKTFVEVGLALSEIRDSKLYKSDFKTFEEYCRKRWGWTRRYSDNLIAAADVVQSLPKSENNCSQIQTESQARELAKVEPEKRVEVIKKAKAVAEEEERPMTARDICEAAQIVHDPGSSPVKPFSRDAKDADSESDGLFQLKRWWKKTSKADRKKFLRWVKSSAGTNKK